jgi:sarcosine oxidase subunit alpha
MLRRHGLLCGDEPALVGHGGELYALARLLSAHGAKLAAIVDVGGGDPPAGSGTAAVAGKDLKAHGRTHVSGLSFARKNGKRKRVDCDAVVVSVPVAPSFELARQGGARVSWHPERMTFAVEADEDGRTGARGLFVAGDQTGHRPVAESIKSGERAADAAASEGRA